MFQFRAVIGLMFFLWASGLAAEPITVARFTIAGTQPLDCERCTSDWQEALVHTFKDVKSPKIITGHIVLIDLTAPNLQPIVTDRDPGNELCGNFVGATRYDPDKVPQPLPVHLKTVPEWADLVNADIAFSGSNFKFRDIGGVRAKPACGEMIGINMHDGNLDWPPQDRPDLLQENIDHNPNWPVFAFLLKANRMAEIKAVGSFEELDDVAFGIGGSALYIDGWDNPNTGSKPKDAIARLGVGIMPDRQHIIFVMLEGDNTKRKDIVSGHRAARLRTLFQALGAISAINLDGSGSAHMVIRNEALGESSRPADTEGPRPIANHIGFRVNTEAVTWTSYGERH